MSVQGHGIDITLIAGADLSAKQFYAVKLDSNGAAVLAGDGEDAVGILQNKPASGQAANVRIVGISKFVAGGAISLPNRVTSDANGKAKAAVAGRTNTSDAGASTDPLIGSFVLGRLLEASGAANQVVSVLIEKSGAIPTTAA